eukprot:1177527-Prorocentrum_minimum.AAC.1
MAPASDPRHPGRSMGRIRGIRAAQWVRCIGIVPRWQACAAAGDVASAESILIKLLITTESIN